MEQVFASSSSASSIARAEAQNKCLCSRGREWGIMAVSKLKMTPPSLFPPQYLLKSLNYTEKETNNKDHWIAEDAQKVFSPRNLLGPEYPSVKMMHF